MGGGGKEPKAGRGLESMAQQLFGETSPLRALLTSQMEEALATGGVGAQIPIIQRAEERARLATSQAMEGVERELARTGLAGTPFGETLRAETARRGEFDISQIRPTMTSQFLAQIPGYTMGTTQTGIGGMGAAATAEAQRIRGLYDLIASMFTAGGQAGAAYFSRPVP